MQDTESDARWNGSVAELDEINGRLLDAMADDARITIAELAARVGIAPSTAHTRLRQLVDRGVITGFHAAIDQRARGLALQALIGVTLRPGSRQESIEAFADDVRDLPEVIQTFFLGGADDYIIHVAVRDSSELRRFVVEHLSGQRSVASTRTSIIFDYHRKRVAASFR